MYNADLKAASLRNVAADATGAAPRKPARTAGGGAADGRAPSMVSPALRGTDQASYAP